MDQLELLASRMASLLEREWAQGATLTRLDFGVSNFADNNMGRAACDLLTKAIVSGFGKPAPPRAARHVELTTAIHRRLLQHGHFSIHSDYGPTFELAALLDEVEPELATFMPLKGSMWGYPARDDQVAHVRCATGSGRPDWYHVPWSGGWLVVRELPAPADLPALAQAIEKGEAPGRYERHEPTQG